jgi:hypothetical protein
MAEKLHGLTKQEITRLQRAMRWVEDNASLLRPYRRIRGQQAGGGSCIRHAYCKTAAGSGSSIVCHLDTDTTGTEITVNCHLFEATNLSDCIPLLTDGKRIPIYQVDNAWYCCWWFNGIC